MILVLYLARARARARARPAHVKRWASAHFPEKRVKNSSGARGFSGPRAFDPPFANSGAFETWFAPGAAIVAPAASKCIKKRSK